MFVVVISSHLAIMASSSSSAAGKWLQAQWWPVILVTGATLASMGVYFRRKWKTDLEIDTDPFEARPSTSEQGCGRKSAQSTGLMEGYRPFQGIFPAKKIIENLSHVLPTTSPDHPSHPDNPKNE